MQTNKKVDVLQILECHAIKYFSKDEYNGRSAAMLVGAKNGSTFYVSNTNHLTGN